MSLSGQNRVGLGDGLLKIGPEFPDGKLRLFRQQSNVPP